MQLMVKNDPAENEMIEYHNTKVDMYEQITKNVN